MVLGWYSRGDRHFACLYMPANYGKPSTERRSRSPRATKSRNRPIERMAFSSRQIPRRHSLRILRLAAQNGRPATASELTKQRPRPLADYFVFGAIRCKKANNGIWHSFARWNRRSEPISPLPVVGSCLFAISLSERRRHRSPCPTLRHRASLLSTPRAEDSAVMLTWPDRLRAPDIAATSSTCHRQRQP